MSQTYLGHISAIFHTYLSYMSGLSQIYYLKHMSDVSTEDVRNILDNLNHTLTVFCSHLKHISNISQTYIRYISDNLIHKSAISWTYVSFVMYFLKWPRHEVASRLNILWCIFTGPVSKDFLRFIYNSYLMQK